MTTANTDPRATVRRRLGQQLMRCVLATGKSLREISKKTGIDHATLVNLDHSALQLRTIETLTAYLQGLAREERPAFNPARWAPGLD